MIIIDLFFESGSNEATKIKKNTDPLPLSRIMACTLLSLSYAHDNSYTT
jgi:hypothetical protein